MVGGHAGDNRMADYIGDMSTGGKIWQVRGLSYVYIQHNWNSYYFICTGYNLNPCACNLSIDASLVTHHPNATVNASL